MRNFKRFLTLALAVLMVVSTFAFTTSAATFTDVDEDNEYLVKSVNLLSYLGVTKGTSETTFGTDEAVTREQMAAFIYRFMKKGKSVEGGANTSTFADLEDPTFYFMVSWANSQNIIKGTSATTFNPKGGITLQDAYTMVVRALGYETEEALPYPFGYIEVAEGKGVELDEGLDSSITYTDELTRGDIAIILYNAFFAETGVAETKQVPELIGPEGDAASNYVLVTKTVYPTFCEKYFDVLEVEYQAVATPNYVFGETETTAALGYDAVLLEKKSTDAEVEDAPAQFYATVEDLGLENADDYIMSYFKTYLVLDEENEVEEILYAEPLMKVMTATEIKFGTLTGNNKASFYNGNPDGARKLSGKITVDGEDMYFYNAPYSYAKPTYGTDLTDTQKYIARNKDNLKTVALTLLGDAEDKEYAYVATANPFLPAENEEVDEYFTNESLELVEAYLQAYAGGLFEADFYDVDGDGIYDYIDYKPYSFATVDTDDEDEGTYEFNQNGLDNGVLYTVDVDVTGEKFEDEDFVIGYFNQAANTAKIAAVVKPVEGAVVDINEGDITLDNDEVVSVAKAWALVANYADLAKSTTGTAKDGLLAAANYVVEDVEIADVDATLAALLGVGAYEADEAEFYIYNGVVLAQDGVTKNIKFEGNVMIITVPEDGTDAFEEGAFSAASKGKALYAYAWVDAKDGAVFDVVELNKKAEIDPDITAEATRENDYVDKLATYSVDSNGLYTVKLLGYAADSETDEYLGLEWLDDTTAAKLEDEEEEYQLYAEMDSTTDLYLVKNVGKRFQLRTADTLNTGNKALDFDLLLDKAVVIIKNEYTANGETKIDFHKLDAATLTETIKNPLTNIQFVVENNVNYDNRENLLVLFASTNDGKKLKYAGLAATKSERIVKEVAVKKNEDGDYYNLYTIINPYTGAVEKTQVAGNEVYSASEVSTKQFAIGSIVDLVNGEVDESERTLGTVLSSDNSAYYWITDVETSNDLLDVVTINSDGTEGTAYRLRIDATPVIVLGGQSRAINADMIKYGSVATAALEDLDGSEKSLKAVKKDYTTSQDADATLKTIYGKYVKAYISVEWDNDDKSAEEDGFNGDAKFIVVINNAGENVKFCKVK